MTERDSPYANRGLMVGGMEARDPFGDLSAATQRAMPPRISMMDLLERMSAMHEQMIILNGRQTEALDRIAGRVEEKLHHVSSPERPSPPGILQAYEDRLSMMDRELRYLTSLTQRLESL